MNDLSESGSWDTQPMPEEAFILQYHDKFTADEYEKLIKGFVPLDMEDKWFIVFDNYKLNFYRNWSGTCIYQVAFSKTGEDYIISRVLVNRNSAQYKETDDATDIKLLGNLIDNLLLGGISRKSKPWWAFWRHL